MSSRSLRLLIALVALSLLVGIFVYERAGGKPASSAPSGSAPVAQTKLQEPANLCKTVKGYEFKVKLNDQGQFELCETYQPSRPSEIAEQTGGTEAR